MTNLSGLRRPWIWLIAALLGYGCGSHGGGGGPPAADVSGAGAAGEPGESPPANGGAAGAETMNPGNGGWPPSDGGARDFAGGAGKPSTNGTTVRVVLGVSPPVEQGTFVLRSGGFTAAQTSCVGSVCIRGFIGAGSR
jgi:hypothetical protein